MGKKQISGFREEEKLLFSMISKSLTQETAGSLGVKEADATLLHALTEFAGHQSVLPIIYPCLSKETNLAEEDRMNLEMTTKKTAAEFYQILFNARNSIELLRKNGIDVALLKGAGVARFYPVAEARKSSDVDLLLLNPKQISQTERVLKENGYKQMEAFQKNHHVQWGTPDNHVLELHTKLIKPTEDKKINKYVAKRYQLTADQLLDETVLGISFPVFADDRMAFHLLLHMLMDFLTFGFGLKLLCDWVVFWNRKVDSVFVDNFVRDVEACGLSNFLSVVTSVCVSYLGLRTDGRGTLVQKENCLCYEKGVFCQIASKDLINGFMQEVLDAERQGKPDTSRMLAFMDTGFLSYIRAFHHQTTISYPKASRLIVPLPVLYIIVFVRFLYNNKTLRGGQSVLGILKKTNQRSHLVKHVLKKQ